MYKIFVVEDEYLESEAIQMIIRQEGQNLQLVGSAASGTEAVEKIHKFQPDIVLMDINIPEINGLDVLKIVKKENPDIKVIIITAFNEFDFAHQAIKAKVDDFLLKPIRPQQLMEAINAVIDQLKDNTIEQFDEKMQEVLYNIVQKRYSNTRKALTEYIDVVYNGCGYDFSAIQDEVHRFLDALTKTATEMLGDNVPELKKIFKGNPNVYKNRYDLKIEIMHVIDRIFDLIMNMDDGHRNTMDDILNYIDRNCHKDISLNQVGEFANMSSYYLSKIFKKETGVNFVTYLTDRKIDIAKDMLLNTDVPIINIALELSYHEPNYFSKVFKKSTGYSPTEYRKQFKVVDNL